MRKVPACLPVPQGFLSAVEFCTRGNYCVQKRTRQGGQRKEGNGWSCPSQNLLHNSGGLGCALFSQNFQEYPVLPGSPLSKWRDHWDSWDRDTVRARRKPYVGTAGYRWRGFTVYVYSHHCSVRAELAAATGSTGTFSRACRLSKASACTCW